jgi:hypothetical protein
MKPYTMSGLLGCRPPSSQSAREQRARRALEALGCYPTITSVRAQDQKSASVATVATPCGMIHVLVSYLTPVAYVLPDGSAVSTERGEYSRTTDRSIDRFLDGLRPIRLDGCGFRDALRRRIAEGGAL